MLEDVGLGSCDLELQELPKIWKDFEKLRFQNIPKLSKSRGLGLPAAVSFKEQKVVRRAGVFFAAAFFVGCFWNNMIRHINVHHFGAPARTDVLRCIRTIP